jgi:hypothetical protein
MTGPGNEGSRERGRLRASHADRERVIGTLKDAFTHGLLAKDEFDHRVGQAFAARTYAELAVVTASVPAEPPVVREPVVREPVVREPVVREPVVRGPTPARVQGEQPAVRPGAVAMVATALCGGVWAFTLIPHWPVNSENDPPHWLVALFFMTNIIYVFVMVIAVGFMIAEWREKRAAVSAAGEG